MEGVFLDSGSLDPGLVAAGDEGEGAETSGDLDLTRLEAAANWTFYPHTDASTVPDRIAGADVVITNKVPLDARAIAAADRLKLIAIAATGTDHVELEAAHAQGVAVANVVGYATPSVTQHVFALLLALATRLPRYQAAVRAGRWTESRHFCLLDFPVEELAGRTLGIAGYGELGKKVAGIAEAFGMTVRIAQLPGRPNRPGRTPLEELLPELDTLSLHCPLTDATRGLIGAEELARLPQHALLINTARGGIVDEPALAEALRAGTIGGAGVDVLGQEPPPPDHPLLAGNLPNLIVTPHTAWASRQARQRLTDELAANVGAFAAGERRNRVV
ncbi:NAD(P)-dependent oxidoreductase [Thiohalorhabdus sp.]|uniref:NAD(P)-dependent oxidoreductase n=1 Tax=Thiohalorhabdus sp. TaxID=3094134 RepID=UPI002FC39FE8